MQVQGTGPGGRVLKGDVLAHVESAGAASAAGAAQQPAAAPAAPAVAAQAAQPAPLPPLPVAAAAAVAGDDPVVMPLRGYRKAMVKSMAAAAQIPHFHFCDEVQVRGAAVCGGRAQ